VPPKTPAVSSGASTDTLRPNLIALITSDIKHYYIAVMDAKLMWIKSCEIRRLHLTRRAKRLPKAYIQRADSRRRLGLLDLGPMYFR